MGRGYRIEGISDLQKKLKRNAEMKDVQRIVKMNGAELQRKAQRNAPVKTGFLKRSIGLETYNVGMTAVVMAIAEYAPYLEWGTRFQSAQPFMNPSFISQKHQFLKDLEKIMK